MKARQAIDAGVFPLAHAKRVQDAKHAGLTYTPGQRVIDKTTRELGTILEGEWAAMGSEQRYAVQLDGAELVERRADELTPSPIAEGVSLSEFDNPKL